MKVFKKIIIVAVIAFSLIYLLIGAILFFNQKAFLYYPDNQDFSNCDEFGDYQKMAFQGTRFM